MLFPCDHCGCFVFAGTRTCPHCDARLHAKAARTAAAAMLVAGVACTGGGKDSTIEPEYGVTVTDYTTTPEPEYGVTVTDYADADTDTDTDADTDTDTDADTDTDTDTDTGHTGYTVEPLYGVTGTTDTGTTTETGGSGATTYTVEPLYGVTVTK
jgi:hypothetical protein